MNRKFTIVEILLFWFVGIPLLSALIWGFYKEGDVIGLAGVGFRRTLVDGIQNTAPAGRAIVESRLGKEGIKQDREALTPGELQQLQQDSVGR